MGTISGSPTLLHVDEVEGTVRFLSDAFGFAVVGSFGGGQGGDDQFAMLENKSRSAQVVVLPKSADISGGAENGGCATLTLAAGDVGRAADAAVQAGARLLCSHGVPCDFPGTAAADAIGAGAATRESTGETEATVPGSTTSGGSSSPARQEEEAEKEGVKGRAGSEARLAWLEFSGCPASTIGKESSAAAAAVRVLLLDDRLLLPPRRIPAAAAEAATAGGEESAEGSEEVSGGEEDSQGGDADNNAESGPLSSSTAGVAGPAGEVRSTPMPLLLSGLAALAGASAPASASEPPSPREEEVFYSCSSDGIGDGASSCSSFCGAGDPQDGDGDGDPLAHHSGSNGQLGLAEEKANGAAESCSADGGISGERDGGDGSIDDGGDGGGGDDVDLLTEASGDVPEVGEGGGGGVDGEGSDGAEDRETAEPATADAVSSNGGSSAATAAEFDHPEPSSATLAARNGGTNGGVGFDAEEQARQDKGLRGPPAQRRRRRRRRRQRPFRQLETFMFGNYGGPLKASPNSIAPIPIDNEHFEGLALLMIKREPMDKSYAHMFEGKNRMFEVQVQGRFKKPPDGELFVSLEITDRMKLGLLTKGLCKLLLSFGQKLNRRLHYSFGDKNNVELPHIAFPLLTSVDSLICTKDGEELPALGKSFMEDKDSKARRRRGEEDNAAGIGDFQTGCTYSFSFHSMYIDMAQWSTCKIPVMRDIDLHTFWGNSALRIAAYVIKSSKPPSSWSSSLAAEAATPHLQSKLEYVFCVQVRHLPQSELAGADSEVEEEEEEEEEEWESEEETPAVAVAAAPEYDAGLGDKEEEGEEEEEGGDEDIDDELVPNMRNEIALPLLTDREPSPRGRQMSASRWASNDDASDGEAETRRVSYERRKGGSRSGRSRGSGDGDSLFDGSGSDNEGAAAASRGLRRSAAGAGAGSGSGSSVEESSDEGTATAAAAVVAVAAAAAERPKPSEGQSQDRADIAAAAGDGDAAGARGGPALSRELLRATTGGAEAFSGGSSDGPRSSLNATTISAGADGSPRVGMGMRRGTSAGAPGMASGSVSGGSRSGDAGAGAMAEDAMVRCPAYVDLYARSPSPKLKGTWTVFVVVKRGADGGGEFALRSSKNLSILPPHVVPTNVEHSPRLSRREAKRRKLDTVLQLLTASSHAHAHRSYQVIVRAVMGMESSADRAFRHYSPAPTADASKAPTSVGTGTGSSWRDGGGGGGGGGGSSRGGSWRNEDANGFRSSPAPSLVSSRREDPVDGVGEPRASAPLQFSAGISVDRALSSRHSSGSPPGAAESAAIVAAATAAAERSLFAGVGPGQEQEQEQSPPFSPRPLSNRSGGSFSESSHAAAGGRSSGSVRRRSWVSRPAEVVKEGMVLRVLSEHHLSQQVAVLLPSSITFSRPRKQCLRLLARDVLRVVLASGLGGGSEDGCGGGVGSATPESQLIPGMYLVEIHTIGRVHYMLVEGYEEARQWAGAIRSVFLDAQQQQHHQSQNGSKGDGGSPTPLQDELSISDPFSQYMTKKSAWKASNFWVLNCRRALELGGSGAGSTGWGGGCWVDEGGQGGRVCEFVVGLLKQALELNDDSKPEQLIPFLDDICRLRWMPLEGLSQSEQLSVFLNLYHVMLLHAFFILGPPGSPLRVASYFTTLCYEVGGDVLSMADLEHCVLRARTSQPKQFLSKLIIPTSEYPFSLRRPEPRVSFALNCGSVSGVPGILIYRPEIVEQQLDAASTYYVQTTSEVHVGKRTVVLPKIMSWYSDDFNGKVANGKVDESGGGLPSSSSSSSLACLLQVKRYFAGQKRRQLEALLSDGGNVSVKFGSWNWKCRPVSLVPEAELASLKG